MLTSRFLITTSVLLLSVLGVPTTATACIFGPDCLLPCTCQTGDCDPQTGTCLTTDTCSPDYPPLHPWSGHGCQTGNVAYGRQRVMENNQVSNPIDGAIVVDGDLNTCVMIDTDDAWNNPYWIVDLEDMYVIQQVDIYKRLLDGYDANSFTARLSISLSNTDSFDSNSPSCGTYEGPFQEPMSIQCETYQIARYLRIRRLAVGSQADPTPERFHLCEVAVVGHRRLDVDCDQCVIQNADFCGNGIWCEECQAGFEAPDCRVAASTEAPSTSTTSPTTTTSSSTTSQTSTVTPSTSTVTSSSTSSTQVPSTVPILSSSTTQEGDIDIESGSTPSTVPPSQTPITEKSDDQNSSGENNDTSIQLIIFTVVGIFIVILVTLIILGICVCIRRHRHPKHPYSDTPNSTLGRRQRANGGRHLENGYPHNNNNGYNEEYAGDTISRHSSILDINVMETIHEEKEKDSSKHSSCSSLHSSGIAKADGSASLNGSVKRYSNRSL